MDSAIIVAIISSSLSLVGTIITVKSGNKKQREDITRQLAEHNRLQDERIKQLSDRVEKHNRVVERTYELEGRVECMSRRITDLTNRS